MLRAVIDHGIMEGVFSDVDTEHAARALITIVDGARTLAVVLNDAEALDASGRRRVRDCCSSGRGVWLRNLRRPRISGANLRLIFINWQLVHHSLASGSGYGQ